MGLFERIGAARKVNRPSLCAYPTATLAEDHGRLTIGPIERTDWPSGNGLAALHLVKYSLLIESRKPFQRAIETAECIGQALGGAMWHKGLPGDGLDIDRCLRTGEPDR